MAVTVTVAVTVALSHLCLPHTADGGSQPSHITQLCTPLQTLQRTLNILQCTVHSEERKMFSVQCTAYTLHNTVHSENCTVYTLNSTLNSPPSCNTLLPVLHTCHCATLWCSAHYSLSTMLSTSAAAAKWSIHNVTLH